MESFNLGRKVGRKIMSDSTWILVYLSIASLVTGICLDHLSSDVIRRLLFERKMKKEGRKKVVALFIGGTKEGIQVTYDYNGHQYRELIPVTAVECFMNGDDTCVNLYIDPKGKKESLVCPLNHDKKNTSMMQQILDILLILLDMLSPYAQYCYITFIGTVLLLLHNMFYLYITAALAIMLFLLNKFSIYAYLRYYGKKMKKIGYHKRLASFIWTDNSKLTFSYKYKGQQYMKSIDLTEPEYDSSHYIGIMSHIAIIYVDSSSENNIQICHFMNEEDADQFDYYERMQETLINLCIILYGIIGVMHCIIH